MKKNLLLFFSIIALWGFINAQAPSELNYQAIVRNSSGNPLAGGSSSWH